MTKRLAIPRSVVLRGRRWRIRYMTPAGMKGRFRGLDGHCDQATRTIDVKPSLSQLQRERTAVHEVLHAIWPEDVVSDAVEERLIRRLETPLRTLLVSGSFAVVPDEVA